jgi:hypothetical protein
MPSEKLKLIKSTPQVSIPIAEANRNFTKLGDIHKELFDAFRDIDRQDFFSKRTSLLVMSELFIKGSRFTIRASYPHMRLSLVVPSLKENAR